MVPLTKAEVESQEGKYSDTGFFNLTKGGFYDPFGYYFNEAGLDAVGGCYEDGLYQDPDEEYKDAEDSYGDEAE